MNVAATVRPAPAAATEIDIDRIRGDFPILQTQVNGRPLVYFDNAASAQMPRQVIDRIVRYRTSEHANIHRGVHYLSETATAAYEQARGTVRRLLNAREESEVIFTSGTTDAINLVMHGYGRRFIGAGDEIILSWLEHHSNIVPWQMLRDAHGIELRVIPIDDAGELDMAALEQILSDRKVGLVSVTHMSNVLGTVTPAQRIAALAHSYGAKVKIGRAHV